MTNLWQPGDYITGRNIWHGQVFTAWVFVVVEDRGDLIAAYTPPGTVWKSPVDMAGNDVRLPHGDWQLRDNVWHGRGMVRVFLKDTAHSVLASWETRRSMCMLNLEARLTTALAWIQPLTP